MIPVWRILMYVCLWHFKVSSRDVAIVKIMWVSMTSRECSYLDRWQFQIWRFGDVKRTLGMQYGFTWRSSAAVCLHTAWRFTIWRYIPHEEHTLRYCGLCQWLRGPGVALWLRRCDTSRTVPGSIPGGVTWDFFRGALRSTQPLKMSTRDFSWGKGGRCFWLTTYRPCSAESREDPGP
jgi:hypothetical protein